MVQMAHVRISDSSLEAVGQQCSINNYQKMISENAVISLFINVRCRALFFMQVKSSNSQAN